MPPIRKILSGISKLVATPPPRRSPVNYLTGEHRRTFALVYAGNLGIMKRGSWLVACWPLREDFVEQANASNRQDDSRGPYVQFYVEDPNPDSRSDIETFDRPVDGNLTGVRGKIFHAESCELTSSGGIEFTNATLEVTLSLRGRPEHHGYITADVTIDDGKILVQPR